MWIVRHQKKFWSIWLTLVNHVITFTVYQEIFGVYDLIHKTVIYEKQELS